MRRFSWKYSSHLTLVTWHRLLYFLCCYLLTCSAGLLANVTGSDLQNFNSTTNGLDFVTVHSSKTLSPGITNFGFFSNYAVNTLARYSDSSQSFSGGTRDSITAADFNFGLGLTNRLDIGFSLPYILDQRINDSSSRGEFKQVGLTEIRGNVKYRFWDNSNQGAAAVISFNQNTTENNPYAGVGTYAGTILNLEFIYDIQVSSFMASVNIGYRNRQPGSPIDTFPIEPLTDQVIASAAVSTHFSEWDTKLVGEIFASRQVAASADSQAVSASEALLGLKYDGTRNLAMHLGFSTKLENGTSSPDWRIYTGINLVVGNYKHREVQLTSAKKKKKKKKSKKSKAVKKTSPPKPELPESIMANFSDYPPELPGVGDDVFVLRDVNFAFNSDYMVVKGARDELDKLSDHLIQRGYKKIIIEGHTDSIGRAEYNSTLGRRRAMKIRNYLVKKRNLDASRIKVLSFGEYRPIADNGNFQGRLMNRRVVFRIIY